jgi:hypothetical protein
MLTYSIRKIPTLKQIVRCKIFADLFILTSMVSFFFYGNGKIAQILENDIKKKKKFFGELLQKINNLEDRIWNCHCLFLLVGDLKTMILIPHVQIYCSKDPLCPVPGFCIHKA